MRLTSSSGARAGREAAVAVSAGGARREHAARGQADVLLRPEERPRARRRRRGTAPAGTPTAPSRATRPRRRRRWGPSWRRGEQSMKHRGVSAFRNPRTNPSNAAGKGDGLFVQVECPGAGTRPKTASSGSSCSGLSAEEVESPYVNFGRRSRRDIDKLGDPGASVDGSCGSSDVISGGFADLPGTTSSPSPGRKEQIGQEEGEASWVDQEEAEDSGACCRSDISEELGARYQGNLTKDCGSSMDDISSAFGGMNFQDLGADAAATSQGNKLTMSRRRTPRGGGGERIRAFNPRAPNFLPVVPDPDAEKVDLRHQMTDDRKNAEEWMVDYALRRTVNKLARAQKRKVEMLVQAFETVLTPVPGEKNYLQDNDKKSLAKCN